MAKESNKLRNTIAIITGTIAILGIFATIVLGWGDLGNKIENQAEDITTIIEDADDLSREGCKPSAKNTFDVAIVQKDIKTIQSDLTEMKEQQTEGFRQILERLPKK